MNDKMKEILNNEEMTFNVEKMTETDTSTQEMSQNNVANVKKKSRKLPKCVRTEEFKELIKVVPSKDIDSRLSFLLAYGAGFRVSEVTRCKPEHFRESSIFIPESKYGVERIVPIPKGWKKEFIKHLPIKKSKRTLQRNFSKYAAKAKLNPNYSFHSLRHGFATRLMESGVPMNQVQILMGHSNLATTSVYTKANPMDALKSYEELF
jgi:site-specific recombinase XerD